MARFIVQKDLDPPKHFVSKKVIVGKELTTQNGFENRGSNHHPLLTINSDCEFIYKRLEELSAGDRVCIQRAQNVFGNTNIPDEDALSFRVIYWRWSYKD